MSEQQKVDHLDNDKVNQAAHKFMLTAQDIKNYATNMGGKELARVLSAVMEFPFNRKKPEFRTKAGEELFLMCIGIQTYKHIMSDAIKLHEGELEELKKQAAEAVAEQIANEQ